MAGCDGIALSSVLVLIFFCCSTLYEHSFYTGVGTIPLHRRILRSEQSSTVLDEEQRREELICRRKVWNKGEGEKQMELALRDVANGTLTVRKAALAYGIPKSTLHDHASGKVRPGAGVGLPKYLTNEEEDELVKWLEGCAEVRCAKSTRRIRAVVGAIVAKKLGVECAVVSHGWWDRFRQRHPHLTLRAGEALVYLQAVATSPETLTSYFDQLEDIRNTKSGVYTLLASRDTAVPDPVQ